MKCSTHVRLSIEEPPKAPAIMALLRPGVKLTTTEISDKVGLDLHRACNVLLWLLDNDKVAVSATNSKNPTIFWEAKI